MINLHTEYTTEEEYYKPVEDLVNQEIDYCGMKCKVFGIYKYVKPKHFDIAGWRCLYVLQIIDPTPEQLEKFDEGCLWASSKDIMHSFKNF